MYQFSTQTIINSNLDSNGTTAKYKGSSTQLNVTRVGTFKKDKIVSIYKRPYTAGVKEVAQVTIPTVTAGKVVRVEANVRLEQSTNSEYANSFLWFQKPVVIEVIASGTAATDATALKNQLNALKDRFGFSYITATTSGANLILTATDNNQRFNSVKVLKELASYNSIIQPEYEDVTAGTFTVTTKGKLGFGDDEFMIKSIQVPTYENTRHFGISQEERPVLGGNYTQYTLRYSGTKDGQDGIVSGATFVTTHVFYVKSDLVSGFETELAKLGLTSGYKLNAATSTGSAVTLSTAGDETDQIEWSGAIGTVTFASDQPTRATVNSTGLVTTAGVTGTGDVVITLTDSVGQTATVSYTVAS